MKTSIRLRMALQESGLGLWVWKLRMGEYVTVLISRSSWPTLVYHVGLPKLWTWHITGRRFQDLNFTKFELLTCPCNINFLLFWLNQCNCLIIQDIMCKPLVFQIWSTWYIQMKMLTWYSVMGTQRQGKYFTSIWYFMKCNCIKHNGWWLQYYNVYCFGI